MSGYRAPYVPGWDTHGLPIEHQLTKSGYDRKKMSTSEFRDLCRKYALEQVDKQRTDFKRLGVSGEWDHPYLTLDKEFEAAQIRVFGEFAKKGHGLRNLRWRKLKLNTMMLLLRRPSLRNRSRMAMTSWMTTPT